MTRDEGVEVPFGLEITRDGSTVVIAPYGEIDLLNARTLYARLVDHLQEDLAELIVDFAAVSFIDSTGLAALVKAARRLGASGVEVRITNASAHATRVLQMTGVDRTIQLG